MKYILVAQQVYFLSESLDEMRKQEGTLTIQALNGTEGIKCLDRKTKKSAYRNKPIY